MNTGVGPFFWIKGRILADVKPISDAENRAGKLDNPVSHSDLYDRTVKYGEYMLIPRGRVVWDSLLDEGILYIDKCLNVKSIVDDISKTFGLTKYRIEHDEHYICPKCKPKSFRHLM